MQWKALHDQGWIVSDIRGFHQLYQEEDNFSSPEITNMSVKVYSSNRTRRQHLFSCTGLVITNDYFVAPGTIGGVMCCAVSALWGATIIQWMKSALWGEQPLFNGWSQRCAGNGHYSMDEVSALRGAVIIQWMKSALCGERPLFNGWSQRSAGSGHYSMDEVSALYGATIIQWMKG